LIKRRRLPPGEPPQETSACSARRSARLVGFAACGSLPAALASRKYLKIKPSRGALLLTVTARASPFARRLRRLLVILPRRLKKKKKLLL
jgi:hypothetical protein